MQKYSTSWCAGDVGEISAVDGMGSSAGYASCHHLLALCVKLTCVASNQCSSLTCIRAFYLPYLRWPTHRNAKTGAIEALAFNERCACSGHHACLSYLLTAKMLTNSKGHQSCCMRRAAHPLPDAAGAVKVKGKKVISGFGAWGVKKKWESTFSPGSPVILKGKASRRNGAPLKRACLTACCQMPVTPLMHPLRSDVLFGLSA